ncbi:hypothetical protein GCM10011344_42560 [Dokdonia pacifica]|uniref:Uncharacterized protein n=1 Tax=Dokdonia pacifica TaxID=1627892 RepID=A0A239DMZ0_9FLAO|nr:hypothetical protein [Dokdonia pacifica]GGG37250.1 hypothetical protein GCM10011344_42560 [Dokdonia pacifica]SNS33840.1 hypothetical protein SAMN06265376_111106 [Dokdonia pacifica]
MGNISDKNEKRKLLWSWGLSTLPFFGVYIVTLLSKDYSSFWELLSELDENLKAEYLLFILISLVNFNFYISDKEFYFTNKKLGFLNNAKAEVWFPMFLQGISIILAIIYSCLKAGYEIRLIQGFNTRYIKWIYIFVAIIGVIVILSKKREDDVN